MMKRCLSLFLAVALIAVLVVPVSADEGNEGGWIDLLESSSVQSNGENWFTVAGTSGTFTVPVSTETILRNVDILVWHPNADQMSSASCTNNGSTTNLTVVYLGNNISRIYGKVPNKFYEKLEITVKKSTSTTSTFQLLSCRVTPLQVTSFSVDADLRRYWSDPAPIKCPGNFTVDGTGSYGDATTNQLIRIDVNDWQKYDKITIYGSFNQMAVTSVRASIGNLGLPYEITYMQSVPTGTDAIGQSSYEYHSWTETNYYTAPDNPDEGSSEDGYGSGESTEFSTITFGGNVLYTITIDVTGIDRTQNTPLVCVFTNLQNPAYGYSVNVQNISGAITLADTSSVSWWNRFTSFMTDLFGAKDDSSALDDLGSSSNSISQNTSQISDFEHSQQAVLDNNFAQIQGAISFTNFAAALVFVQKYTNMTFNGISKYAIVFTLPLFLGLFFYLCSRIPGITRWKTPPPRSPSPKSKGGGKT